MINYREFVTETVRDPVEAAEYLRASLDEYFADGNPEAFLTAVRTLAEARGGWNSFAGKTGLNPKILDKTLSEDENPGIRTLGAILYSLGFKLSVEPVSSANL